MGIISSNKKINVDTMKCDGTARVSLAITAAPDILENPADIVLVLDRSGSMSGTPLASMKEGAKPSSILLMKQLMGTRMDRSALAAASVLSAFRIPLRSMHR